MAEFQETPEYSNFQKHYYELMYAIEEPLPLAARLFSLGIIEQAVLQRVSLASALPSLEKGVILLSAVEAQIQAEPNTFHVFLKALRVEPSLQHLAESMEGRLSIIVLTELGVMHHEEKDGTCMTLILNVSKCRAKA